MSNGNSTTVDVDLFLRETEELQVGKSHNTEGLVDLEGIDSILGDTGVLESLRDGQSRGSGELAGLLLSVTPAENLGNGLEAKLLDLGLGNQDDSGGAVVQRGGVGGGDSSSTGDEGGLDGTELLGVELKTNG